MAISSINTDVLRGNVTTIILGSLWNQDKYGYEILKEIEDKSDGHFKIKQPTLYNQLKRLEKQGLISSYEGDPNDTGGGQRCYYKLTDEGKQFLTKERSEYEYSRTILDKLVSDDEYDFGKPAPFDTEKLRPYSLKDDKEEKVVYKDKIVEKVVEKKVYLDMYGNEITPEEAEDLKNQKVIEDNTPSKTIDELFKEIDNKPTANAQDKPFWVKEDSAPPKEYTEPNYYNAELESTPDNKPESTLEELFKQIDEKHQEEELKRQEIERQEKLKAEEEAKKIQEEQNNKLSYIEQQQELLRQEQEALRLQQEEFQKQQYSYNQDKQEYTVNAYETSSPQEATLNQRTDGFQYENNDVNYKDFFASIAPTIEDEPIPEPVPQKSTSNDNDLRSRIYREGYKIRPYTKGNTSEYYSFNFIHQNRINRDTGLITMGLYVVLAAIMWLSMMDVVSFKYFVPVILIGILGGLAPTVIYTLNPTRRIRAEFSLKRSLINRSMLLIECLVIAVLIGVFGFHASQANPQILYETIIVPFILFLCFPASSIIYWLLYRTKKYHIA